MAQEDLLEKKYASLQYMDCTMPLGAMDKELCFVCFRWGTSDEIDHTIIEDGNREFSVDECFELEPYSTVRGVVHVVRCNCSVKSFCNASSWSYY